MNLSPIRISMLEMTNDEFNYSLSPFVCEIKKADRNPYPGKSLYEMICSIQKFLEMNRRCIKLLDDPALKEMQLVVNTKMKKHAWMVLVLRRKQPYPLYQARRYHLGKGPFRLLNSKRASHDLGLLV